MGFGITCVEPSGSATVMLVVVVPMAYNRYFTYKFNFIDFL
jgi:hypothetical protein